MRIVLLETTSNQPFIFGSNRLRENVGASEMIYRVGTKFILEEVDKLRGGTKLGSAWNKTSALAALLTSDADNPRIEEGQTPVEVVVAASGKAILLVESEEVGRRLIQQVTGRTLRETPGVTLHGVLSEKLSFHKSLDDQFREVHRRHMTLRNELAANETRFPRLPVVASCATSGWPAAEYDNASGNAGEPRSYISATKQYVGAKETFDRMQRMAGGIQLAKSFETLEKEFEDLEWLAVVHADGNRLGRIFQAFGVNSDTSSDARGYLNALRCFSLALDLCTQQAFAATVNALCPNQKTVPIVPLVLGGDDLTIVCDGKMAVQFAAQFLQEFERVTNEDRYGEGLEHLNGTISAISQRATGQPRLTACAGVAMVKPHFPFHAAYELAESLLAHAKQVKKKATACSALDFYVHNMSSNVGLEAIRDELDLTGGTVLYGGPYVTTDEKLLPEIQDDTGSWLANHRWNNLERQVAVLRERDPNDPGQRLLPNSLTHRIRATLHDGHQAAQDYLNHVKNRYPDVQRLCGNGHELFWSETRANGEEFRQTSLLDAMSLVDLWLDKSETASETEENA